MGFNAHQDHPFDDPSNPTFRRANHFLAIVTIISILTLILETVPSLSAYHQILLIIEYITVGIFTVEYLYRLSTAPQPLRYAISPFGLIDLLAIAPTFVGLGNLSFLKTARAIRILRFLRLLRLAKVGRDIQSDSKPKKLLTLEIYALSLAFVVTVLATLAYTFAEHEPFARDIPTAMHWIFLVILGDLPFAPPITDAGNILLVVARFAGLLLLGFLIGIVASYINKLLVGSTSAK
jgi:voltage-gated potassium channel